MSVDDTDCPACGSSSIGWRKTRRIREYGLILGWHAYLNLLDEYSPTWVIPLWMRGKRWQIFKERIHWYMQWVVVYLACIYEMVRRRYQIICLACGQSGQPRGPITYYKHCGTTPKPSRRELATDDWWQRCKAAPAGHEWETSKLRLAGDA